MKNKTKILVFLFIIFAFEIYAQNKEDALLEYRNGNYNEAIRICKKEIERTPGNMDSYVVLGWSFLKKGEYQNALDYGNKALNVSKYDIRIIEILGETNYYLGKNQTAMNYFQEYIKLAPTGDRIELVYYFMGEIYIRLGKYKHADISLTTAIYHYSNSARWWARLGYAREMAEDWEYSLEAYQQALKQNSALIEASRGIERVRKKLNSQ